MKQKYCSLFLLFIVFVSCRKIPTANFTTDKTAYNAGETIHCTDVSDNAYSWKWTAPNGNIYTTQNLDFVTDINEASDTKTFTLEVASKDGKKNSTISKSITINELILSSDYFSSDSGANNKIIPLTKSCGVNNGNWVISASFSGTNVHGVSGGSYLDIFLPTTSPPLASGTYSLQTNHTSLMTGQASISLKTGDNDVGYQTYNSNSGQLNVSITSTGKVRVVFNNIPTAASYIFLSGDITCH